MTESSPTAPLPGTMPQRLPENAPVASDFNPGALAKGLLRTIRAGTLATLDRNTGHPFASLVNVATDVDGSPLILTSRLSTHTANLEVDGRCSILLAETGKGDPLAHPRLTVLGTMTPIERDSTADARRANGVAGITPERVIREGVKAEEVLKLIDEDEDIAILVLAASSDNEGPGPLVANLSKTAGTFPIPVAIVPSHLSDEELDALS